MKILHIEDDLTIARTVARLLAKAMGAEVSSTDTADEAIEMLKTNEYDLVISDYDLKVGTGGDVLQWVKDNRPEQRWLFLAGNDAVQSLGKPYLTKPAPLGALRAAIAELMS